jgi:hypothetical protein
VRPSTISGAVKGTIFGKHILKKSLKDKQYQLENFVLPIKKTGQPRTMSAHELPSERLAE